MNEMKSNLNLGHLTLSLITSIISCLFLFLLSLDQATLFAMKYSIEHHIFPSLLPLLTSGHKVTPS